MKILPFPYAFLFFLIHCISCVNGIKNSNVDVGTATQKKADISNYSENRDQILGDKTTMLMSKLESKSALKNNDYKHLCHLLLNDSGSDESFREGFGYLIFQYFRYNSQNNLSLGTYLDKKSEIDRERILGEMTFCMCIDIGEEGYNYEQFVKDFEVFENSASAKESFDRCIANWGD